MLYTIPGSEVFTDLGQISAFAGSRLPESCDATLELIKTIDQSINHGYIIINTKDGPEMNLFKIRLHRDTTDYYVVAPSMDAAFLKVSSKITARALSCASTRPILKSCEVVATTQRYVDTEFVV